MLTRAVATNSRMAAAIASKSVEAMHTATKLVVTT